MHQATVLCFDRSQDGVSHPGNQQITMYPQQAYALQAALPIPWDHGVSWHDISIMFKRGEGGGLSMMHQGHAA